MTAKTHQLLGVTAGLTFFLASTEPVYQPATFGAVLAFSYLGALLPDIDQPTGKLWHLLPFGDHLAKIPTSFIEHRNITHSLLGMVGIGIGLFYLFRLFPPYWGIDTLTVFIVTMVAYFSHLFADMWTVEGIPLFFPLERFFGLPPKPFEGVRVQTGKWFENLVLFPLLTLFFIIFILSNLGLIKTILLK